MDREKIVILLQVKKRSELKQKRINALRKRWKDDPKQICHPYETEIELLTAQKTELDNLWRWIKRMR